LERFTRGIGQLVSDLQSAQTMEIKRNLEEIMAFVADRWVVIRPEPVYRFNLRSSAPSCRWCAKKNGGQDQQALGRSRGGFSTKIHLGCISETHSISIVVTGGQIPDVSEFDSVFQAIPEENGLKNGIMDKGYDSDEIRRKLAEAKMASVIPPRSNRIVPIAYDEQLYKQRNRIERFINRIKQFRRIATRYEKLAGMYLAFLHIVSSFIALS
jgi:transposase